MFVAVGFVKAVHLTGFFYPPIDTLVQISRFYSFVAGHGIVLGALLVFGFVQTGAAGVAGFIVGRAACAAVFGVVGFFYAKLIRRKTGLFVTWSERSFFHAYRLEASRLEISTDLNVTEAELSEANWRPAFDDLDQKWPKITARFTSA